MKISARMRNKPITNIVIALLSQLLTALVGMLLPRALMINYGSETNGLITSMQQIIGYLTLIEGGLLATVAVSLYKPLAEENIEEVDRILSAAKYFYRRTGVIFLIALLILALLYPLFIAPTQYCYWQVLFIVILIGVNGATQILFIGKYKALLMASQNNGIILMINAISTGLFSGLLIIISWCKIDVIWGLSIAVTAYPIRAICFYFVCRKLLPQYSFSGDRGEVVFKQRNNALGSQILNMLSLNGGVIILTICKAPMTIVSVYTTYNLVLSAIFMLMYSIDNTMTAVFGKNIAQEDGCKLKSYYKVFDTLFQMLWIVVGGCLACLMLPFIRMFTIGVEDIQYILPFESILFVLIALLWLMRNQQTLLMTAKGDFQKMRKYASVEAVIVLIGGCVLYLLYGLKGMLISKLIATAYMLLMMSRYSYKVILKMPLWDKIKNILLSLICILIIYVLFGRTFGQLQVISFMDFFKLALVTFILSVMISLFFSFTFNLKDTKAAVRKFLPQKVE